MKPSQIVIGTRGSKLAQAQARMVSDGLRARWADLAVETKIITTSGDENNRKIRDAVQSAGRKGLFTAEIERALLAGDVDLAVHSAKDLPSELTAGTEIAAVLPRAPVDDVLISIMPWDLHSLPANGIVATGSVRRKHQLRWKRPDLEIVDLRGNVMTRLRKLAIDQWHAIILARAGLERLGLETKERRLRFEESEFSIEVLPQEFFLPAGGQGVIAMQVRSGDDRARMLVEPLNDFDTRLCLRAEREFLRLLHGDCNQPVGVLAIVDGAIMKIRGQVFDLEATTPRKGSIEGPSEDAEQLAARLLEQINGE
ncbi:MAG: hydroxymethylbilane synthase [Verrucomicrobia bacterium]|nr:MAG: hydroxymethylbilane synthase [Verrucomicrobiota bacterium]PYK93066.1 MAG: hydroxymethylbilane synthase [Verrucomicrobiota bacterium]PYL58039.1 MAG: hydroxymethylbilane synthase [Verrucomicrobiota bacterium]